MRLEHRPELDGLRGVAILLVVLQHFVFADPRWGEVGVTLFFVLSGYLITGLLLAEWRGAGRIDLRSFYVRRARRLAPALIALVVVLVVLGAPGNPIFALTYTSNIATALGLDVNYYHQTWTLAIEEQFYLVWPVLFVLFYRRIAWLLVAAMAIGVVLRIAFPAQDLTRSDALGAGALLAVWGGRFPRWAGIAGWVALAAALAVGGGPTPLVSLPVVAASALVVGSGGFVTWAPLRELGGVSYALYLWNYPVMRWLVRLTPPTAIFGVTLSLLLAVVSTRCIEAPFRRSAHRDDHHAAIPVRGTALGA